jgi:uncharacterized protein
MSRVIRLKQLTGTYAICRLDPDSAIPSWADGRGFLSITRSDDELSIVCLETRIPSDIRQDGGWTCVKFIGPFAFDDTGIVASVIMPLSANGIGIFVVSTFDGDHLLVKTADLPRVRRVLAKAGHDLTE